MCIQVVNIAECSDAPKVYNRSMSARTSSVRAGVSGDLCSVQENEALTLTSSGGSNLLHTHSQSQQLIRSASIMATSSSGGGSRAEVDCPASDDDDDDPSAPSRAPHVRLTRLDDIRRQEFSEPFPLLIQRVMNSTRLPSYQRRPSLADLKEHLGVCSQHSGTLLLNKGTLDLWQRGVTQRHTLPLISISPTSACDRPGNACVPPLSTPNLSPTASTAPSTMPAPLIIRTSVAPARRSRFTVRAASINWTDYSVGTNCVRIIFPYTNHSTQNARITFLDL
jgi:hypothetical protein